MKITKEYCRYRKSLENLIRTRKDDELSKKIGYFYKEGKGFTITKIRRVDYNRIINRDRRFWQDLGFKEINIKSTQTSKKTNKLIKITRERNGRVFYNCWTKKKLAFLIPTREKLQLNHERKCPEMVDCYTIIIL